MHSRLRPFVLGVFCSLLVACNNENFENKGTISAGARFRLVIDQRDSARLLVDSATGDVWQLQPDPSGVSKWAKLANGPADAKALTPQQALGLGAKKASAS